VLKFVVLQVVVLQVPINSASNGASSYYGIFIFRGTFSSSLLHECYPVSSLPRAVVRIINASSFSGLLAQHDHLTLISSMQEFEALLYSKYKRIE
jgi:hypothetical protein